jgi:hypothetical protein
MRRKPVSRFFDSMAPLAWVVTGLFLALSAAALPAAGQTRETALCDASGALETRIGAIAQDGTITLAEGIVISLANIAWPDAAEPLLRRKLVDGLNQSLAGQRISWKPVAGPDRWGITPAFVFVQEPGATMDPVRAPFWLQAGMVELGLVPAWPDVLAGTCWQSLLSHERIAITRRRGHWAPRVQSQRIRQMAAAPAHHAGRKFVALWQVADVRPWRELTFLNLAGQPRGGIALSLTQRTVQDLRQAGFAFHELPGRRVIARVIVPVDGLRRARIERAEHLQMFARAEE